MLVYIYAAMSLIVSPIAMRSTLVTHNKGAINMMFPNAGNIDTTYNELTTVYKHKLEHTSQYKNPTVHSTVHSLLSTMEITKPFINFYNSIKIKSQEKANELLYKMNKKTKVYIHIEQLIPHSEIYHIGITFKTVSSQVRYDMVGKSMDKYTDASIGGKHSLYSTTLLWEYTDKTLDEVMEFEKNMEHQYVLGVNDCRHYVRLLTAWACDKPTPIWLLAKLANQIRRTEQ
jgi:hypothetical protein